MNEVKVTIEKTVKEILDNLDDRSILNFDIDTDLQEEVKQEMAEAIERFAASKVEEVYVDDMTKLHKIICGVKKLGYVDAIKIHQYLERLYEELSGVNIPRELTSSGSQE